MYSIDSPALGTDPVAVVHGRFQPLHIGHLEYLLAGARRAARLIVGITNPDPWQSVAEPTDPHRGEPESNPFTFYERYLMVEAALCEHDVTGFRIVPFPHGFPERLHHYVPADALLLFTIYDAWGEEKARRLSGLGWRTEVMWRRTAKVTSGTELRRRMREGAGWDHLVPAGTASVIRELRLSDRLREASR